MRAFIAIELPQETKECLQGVQSGLLHLGLDAKWVEKQNLHMTLKFLGEIDDAALVKVKECIQTCSQQFQPLVAKLVGFGFFPDSGTPRVFFAETNQETALRKIASCLQDRLQGLCFAKDDKFKAHITLARLKSAKNIALFTRELEGLKVQEEFQINGITLFKSVLSRQGAVYEAILKVNFNS